MRLDDWLAAGRRFDHRGRRFFYRDEGTGPTVLCIHGFPTASWDWHRVWPHLVREHRAVALDMLGFGFSEKPRGHAYSIMEQADVHEALLAALDIDEVLLFAHDYGDTVAQELLARHEERTAPRPRIRGVCFLNGGLFPETHRARRVQKLLLTPLGPLLARLATERAFAAGFSAIFGPRTKPTAAELHDFWRLVRHDGGHRITHRLIRYIPERRRHRERWVGPLSRRHVPMRLVNGPEDPVSGGHMAARYREIVPEADVVLLDGIGHYPQVEDPTRTFAAFREFAARLDSRYRAAPPA
jgi:pimeloyl-ACP methyl ester carboxylesterase